MQDCISDLHPCRRDLGSGALRERWVLPPSPSKCWAAACGHGAVLGTWVLCFKSSSGAAQSWLLRELRAHLTRPAGCVLPLTSSVSPSSCQIPSTNFSPPFQARMLQGDISAATIHSWRCRSQQEACRAVTGCPGSPS